MKQIVNILVFICLFCIPTFATQKSKILTPQEAFHVTFSDTKEALHVNIEVGEQIYVYDDKLKVKLLEPKEVDLNSEIQKPKPVFFHDKDVHRENFTITIPKTVLKKYVNTDSYTLQFDWQGCSEKGLCYQPMKKVEAFKLDGSKAQNANISEQDSIANSLASKSFVWTLLTFFGFGLLLALTPCVFPMIPILSSIIVSKTDEKMDAKKGFLLSLVYVLAMSLAYTIAGVLAGLFGANIQSAMQNPYVLFTFSAIFVALALSMFGFYELQAPQWIQNIADRKSKNAQGKGFMGIAIMGFLSALIVGPCVAAPLAGALIYIGQSGDALLGGAALFMMSLGMGVPLLLIGASAGKFLPKPGFWMDTIKAVFGVLMLGVAIWMLERVISSQLSLLLWSFLLISSAIYLGALEPIQNSNGWKKLLKTFSFVLLLYGSVVFIGSFLNGKNILNPLGNFSSSATSSTNTIASKFTYIKTNSELDAFVKVSKKPILVDFWATWCVSCKELDEITFKDAKVMQALDDFNLVKIDVTDNTSDDKALLKRFNLFGPPGIIFFKNQKELKNMQLVGFVEPDTFFKHLQKVLNFEE